MNTTSASIKSSSAPAASPSRRSFMRYLTAGVAALAVEGCGGGAGTGAVAPGAPSPAAPAPVAPAAPAPVVAAPAAPAWLSIPTIAFTEGTPSSFSIAEYITTANIAEVTVILNATPLPAGVRFNPATRAFDYDGQGAPAVTDGHVLTAAVGA